MPVVQYKNPREDYRRAKGLRKEAPKPERLLWDALCKLRKETGLKFRRQQPLHPYIADFACMKARLVIELDGASHDARRDYDAKRESEICGMGWTIIRFSNDEVIHNLEGVVLAVVAKTKELVS